MHMRLSSRAIVGMTVVSMAAIGAPAFAGGHGGGGGGGGGSGKPVITFKNISFTVSEGGNATITLSRNGTGATSSVIVEPSGAGAVGGAACTANTTPPDYVKGGDSAQGGYMASFSMKATSASVLIPTCNDAVWRGTRTVQLTLDTFVNGQPGSKNTATLAITDPDAKAVVSITDAPDANEGSAQSFTVKLTGTSAVPVSVTASTQDQPPLAGHAVGGTAGSGDYDTNTQNFAWAPGDNTDRTFTVSTTADTVNEPDETYLAVLGSVSNASIGGTGSATGKIIDSGDDDGDGVLDGDDLCANTPTGETVDVFGCSTSQTDTDGDGVYDNVDNCVNAPNPGQEDIDGGGAGEACDNESELEGSSVGTEDGLDPNAGAFSGTITNTAAPFGPTGHPDGSYDGLFGASPGDASAVCTAAGQNQGGFFIGGSVTLTYGLNSVTVDLDDANSYFCVTTPGGTGAQTAYDAHWQGTITSGTGDWSAASGPVSYDGTTSAQDVNGNRSDVGTWSGLITI